MSNPARPADSAKPSPAIGAVIYIVGYPSLGHVVFKAKMTLGRVKPASKNARVSFVTMAVDVRSGDSGGPVLDASGRAIGVVVAKVNSTGICAKTGQLVRDIDVAIPLGSVRRFTENNRIKLLTVDRPEALSDKALFALSRGFVVQVRCWGKK